MKSTCVCFALVLAGLSFDSPRPRAASAADTEQLPEGLKIVEFSVTPVQVRLKHRFDHQQLLLTGRLASVATVDLTRMAKLQGEPKHSKVTERLSIRAVSSGDEQLEFKYGEHVATVDVTVGDLSKTPKVSFVRDVQPLLGKMGCNAGTCHGAKDGKAGFKLSLRGYDPLYDHRSLTDDIAARRFNRAAPDQSLFLLKATGAAPHVGGVRTTVGHAYYEILRQWIAEGAALDLESPRVTSIELSPKNPIVPRAGMKQQIRVVAHYADGESRDVTSEAFIESGNIEVVSADTTGVLSMLRLGEAPVLVRYEGSYAATTLTVMGDRRGFVWKQPPTYNYIDEHVYNKLERVRVLPGDVCDDAEFLRRVYLDTTGLPPTPQTIREFLADPADSRKKREMLVDQLLGNPEYIEHWTNKWADLLQVNRKFLGEEGSMVLRNWIKQAVASNKPYDEMAYEIITASGSTIENPAAAYYKVLRDPTVLMENTTHLFLAVRFNCNKCHDHPFERWTQDQYYNLAAYFAQVGRKEDPMFAGKKIGGSAVEGAKPLVEVVYDTSSGEVKHDRTLEIARPAFPFRHDDEPETILSRRVQLAHWLTSPKNQYFARSYVNRLWGYLFGRGVIDPIDDIRAGNPPTNPELLDALTADFVDSGFDVRHMLAVILKSRTYQHSIHTNQWNEDDDINFSHAIPRRLAAEVLFDAIHLAAGSTPTIPGVPFGFRAAELPDAGVKVPFLDDFGRPVRESACECERSSGVVLGPIMKLINGPTVANALGDPKNELTRLARDEPDDKKMLQEVFLRFLGRLPTERELNLSQATMNAVGAEHAEIVAALKEYETTLPAKRAAWEKALQTQANWIVVEPTASKSEVGAVFAKRDDKSLLLSGKRGKDVYTVTTPTKLRNVTALRIEVLADKSLPAGGPGRADNGNFVLSEVALSAAAKNDPTKMSSVKLSRPRADFSQSGYGVTASIDGNTRTGWAVAPQFNKAHVAIYEFTEDIDFEGGAVFTIRLTQHHDETHQIGRVRIGFTTSPRPIRLENLPDGLAKALSTPADKRSKEQRRMLDERYASQDKQLTKLREAVRTSEEQMKNGRLIGLQDVAWALINTPAFLFNR